MPNRMPYIQLEWQNMCQNICQVEWMPDRMSKYMPDTMPNWLPDRMPGGMSEYMSTTMPEYIFTFWHVMVVGIGFELIVFLLTDAAAGRSRCKGKETALRSSSPRRCRCGSVTSLPSPCPWQGWSYLASTPGAMKSALCPVANVALEGSLGDCVGTLTWFATRRSCCPCVPWSIVLLRSKAWQTCSFASTCWSPCCTLPPLGFQKVTFWVEFLDRVLFGMCTRCLSGILSDTYSHNSSGILSEI